MERARLQENEHADETQETTGDAIELAASAAVAELVSLADLDQGPGAVAGQLCKAAGLNVDQRRCVALYAWPMQQALNNRPPGTRDLPRHGAIARVATFGGGGCGKSRIINEVLTPLSVAFYKAKGLLKSAPSNKASRVISKYVPAKTVHASNKLQGNTSLRTVNLRVPHGDRRKGLERLFEPLGVQLIDEVPMVAAKLLHADAYLKTHIRAPAYKLDASKYFTKEECWGAIPIVGLFGDHLQLPPVPPENSLFAPLEGTSDEHKAGVALFSRFWDCYELTTAYRFKNDDVLRGLLAKMRTPKTTEAHKEGKLTPKEWQALLDTNVTEKQVQDAAESGRTDPLHNTHDWYQACYSWSVVCMATVIRSVQSARASQAPLLIVQALDYLRTKLSSNVNVRDVAEQAPAHPSMNDTGRLPGFGLYHVGMEVRLTQSIDPPKAVTDATGIIADIELSPQEPRHNVNAFRHATASTIVLQHLPTCIYVRLDENKTEFLPPMPCADHAGRGAQRCCRECSVHDGIVAAKPFTNKRAWSILLTIGDHEYKVSFKRKQMPLTTSKASTLHVLQGSTAAPD